MANVPRIESEDGWVHVGKSRKLTRPVSHGPAPLDRSLTLAKLKKDYETKANIWARTPCRHDTLRILDQIKPEDGWPIKTAVCLATGSFSRDNLEHRKRSMYQFVVFMDITSHLRAMSSTGISIYAQDPIYTALDEDFLSYFEISVLHEDQNNDCTLANAKKHIGLQSLVFEPFMDLKYESMSVLFGSDVSLYIGSSLQRKQQSSMILSKAARDTTEVRRRKVELELLERFNSAYHFYQFPRFEDDPNIFEGINIHWRKGTDSDEGG